MLRLINRLGVLALASWMVAPAAQAAPGFGFSQSGATFDVTTISTAVPNVIRTVAVTCLKKGKLWANATGRMTFEVTSNQFAGTVVYALSRNSTSMQADFQQNLFGRFVDNFANIPVAIQRVDSCNSGANVTYRLLATRGTFSTNVKFLKPALVVSFQPD